MVTPTKMAEVVIDTETTNKNPHKAHWLGLSIYNYESEKKSGWFVDNVLDWYVKNKYKFIAHNGKYDAIVLSRRANTDIELYFDTQIAYYLLHIDRRKKLETVVKDVFEHWKQDLLEVYNECAGETRKTLPDKWWTKISQERLAQYAQEDAEWTYRLYQYCQKQFESKPQLHTWFKEIEMPLCNILTQSELKGVKVDKKRLQDLNVRCTKEIKELEQTLRYLAEDNSLNLNSSKQLQQILYKKLKLPRLKKTKTGVSTDTKTLQKLAGKDAFAKLLLRYRELNKLVTAFVIPLEGLSDHEGIIHANYNQMGTRTRRMSCSEPNLQQIPVKTEIGRDLRKCFVSRSMHKFLIADYSQIELRLLAHFSEDRRLVDAFNNGEDIHQQTADFISEKLGRHFTRYQGKTLNFSIIYGKTAFGFARDWSCSEGEAQEILDAYFQYYPGVRQWMENQCTECQISNGWVKTLAGLPLYVENINSNNKWRFEEAKRQAVNYKIQGSSQDILKKAVVDVYKEYGMYPLLLVHDELVYEMQDKGYDANMLADKDIQYAMENAWTLKVPIKVDYKISSWWEK